jgi:hypothetical protein
MPALLALLSLLGACSGMLDLPDQPRVSMETTEPLQAPPQHEPHPGARGWREPKPWGGAGGTMAETPASRARDAAAADETSADETAREPAEAEPGEDDETYRDETEDAGLGRRLGSG